MVTGGLSPKYKQKSSHRYILIWTVKEGVFHTEQARVLDPVPCKQACGILSAGTLFQVCPRISYQEIVDVWFTLEFTVANDRPCDSTMLTGCPFPRTATLLWEEESYLPCLAKKCYLGGPQSTPPQPVENFVVVLQHSCLLLHCQISSRDICKTQRSELESRAERAGWLAGGTKVLAVATVAR